MPETVNILLSHEISPTCSIGLPSLASIGCCRAYSLAASYRSILSTEASTSAISYMTTTVDGMKERGAVVRESRHRHDGLSHPARRPPGDFGI